MIRRNATDDDGSPQWVLISQLEHARLSAQLAKHWRMDPPLPPSVHRQVLAVVEHHDDGWAEWEQSPQVDAEHGRPLAFTEMPVGQSLAIWQRSIDGAAELGPLAAWMVAGHFRALLEGSSSAQSIEAQRWMAATVESQDRWLTEWLAEDPAANVPRLAQRALAYLRMLDALSLWFCCAELAEAHQVTNPDNGNVRFDPVSPSAVRVAPWIFISVNLRVSIRGEAIRAERYEDSRALASAPRRPVTLDWILEPF